MVCYVKTDQLSIFIESPSPRDPFNVAENLVGSILLAC